MNSVRNRLLVGVVLALSVRATPALAAGCERDIDCGPDEICESKQCVNAHGSTLSQGSGQTADVPMMLVGEDGRPPYKVQDLATSQSCNTPCTMQVPPGARELKVTDETGSDSSFMAVVPPKGGVVRVKPMRVSWYIGAGVRIPFLRGANANYGEKRPAGVKEDAESPYNMKLASVPFGATAAFAFGESSVMMPYLGVQYMRYRMALHSLDGSSVADITYNEVLGCLCLGFGEQDKGFGGTFGTMVGGAAAQTSLSPDRPANVTAKAHGVFVIGFDVGVRYVLLRHFYLGVDAELIGAESKIAIQDGNGEADVQFPAFGMAGIWMVGGIRL